MMHRRDKAWMGYWAGTGPRAQGGIAPTTTPPPGGGCHSIYTLIGGSTQCISELGEPREHNGISQSAYYTLYSMDALTLSRQKDVP